MANEQVFGGQQGLCKGAITAGTNSVGAVVLVQVGTENYRRRNGANTGRGVRDNVVEDRWRCTFIDQDTIRSRKNRVVQHACNQAWRDGPGGVVVTAEPNTTGGVVCQNVIHDHNTWGQVGLVRRWRLNWRTRIRSRSDRSTDGRLVSGTSIADNTKVRTISDRVAEQ